MRVHRRRRLPEEELQLAAFPAGAALHPGRRPRGRAVLGDGGGASARPGRGAGDADGVGEEHGGRQADAEDACPLKELAARNPADLEFIEELSEIPRN